MVFQAARGRRRWVVRGPTWCRPSGGPRVAGFNLHEEDGQLEVETGREAQIQVRRPCHPSRDIRRSHVQKIGFGYRHVLSSWSSQSTEGGCLVLFLFLDTKVQPSVTVCNVCLQGRPPSWNVGLVNVSVTVENYPVIRYIHSGILVTLKKRLGTHFFNVTKSMFHMGSSIINETFL